MKDLSNPEHYTSEQLSFLICVNVSKPGGGGEREEKPLIMADSGGIKSKLQH